MTDSFFRMKVVFLKVSMAEEFILLETGGTWHSQFLYQSICELLTGKGDENYQKQWTCGSGGRYCSIKIILDTVDK